MLDANRSAIHLVAEALGLYFIQCTNEPEKGIHGRQQALADMIPWELGCLEERHLETLAHQCRGGVAASGSATNNEDLSFRRLKGRNKRMGANPINKMAEGKVRQT